MDKTTRIVTNLIWLWLMLVLFIGLFWFASCALKSIRAEGRITPEDLEYRGAFQVPPWSNSVGRFGYGMDSIAYSTSRKSLFAPGHPNGDLVGEISIPTPSKEKPYQRATLLQPFGDVAGALRSQLMANQLDSFGGLAVIDGKLYWSFYRYYSVQPLGDLDHATFGRSSLDLSAPQSEGLWKVGPYGSAVFSQKRTSRYMTEIPSRWSADHLPGRRLAVGKGDGAGSAAGSHGPALFAVGIPEVAESGAALDATALIHYPPTASVFPDWSPCDQWSGVVWIERGEIAVVIFAGRRGVGEADYGKPAEVSARKGRTTCGTGKGYHCDPYAAELVFYDPEDLARVVHGEIQPEQVIPYERMRLEFEGHHCTKTIGGMAYNEDAGEVYLVQDNQENPIVHVWRVGEPKKEERPVITLMDAKLDTLTSFVTTLLLEGASPEDIIATLEMAKLRAEDWKTNEKFAPSRKNEGQ